jgi:hypothetical protein
MGTRSGDRRAQLVRDVTDKVAPNSFEMAHTRLISHHQQRRHLAVQRDRSSVEIAVVQRDRTLFDMPALARGVEQADQPVVDLAGDEVRAIRERKAQQPARGFIGEEHPATGVETDNAGVEEQPHGSQHVDAP